MKMNPLPVILIAFLLCVPACKKNTSNEIIVGALFDLTGQTAETGTKFAEGIRGYIDYANLRGGINGRKIRLIEHDTAYIAARDLDAYDRLVNTDDVHLIIGWSSGSSIALLPKLKKDRIAFTSVSFSKKLADVDAAPFNFLMGPTYSDQVKIIFKHILRGWKDRSRRPRVALIYSDTEFGRSPVADARLYAEKTGIETVAEEVVHLDAREAGDQIRRIKEKNPDYVIMNETVWPASVILKEAKKSGLNAIFVGLIWCSDEKVVALAGKDAEGYIGVFPFQSDADIRGIKEILKYNALRRNDDFNLSARYLNGWVMAMIMMEGVRRAGGDVSRRGIIKGIEGIRNFDTGGITAPFSFSATDHVGNKKTRLGRVVNGKWTMITGNLSADE